VYEQDDHRNYNRQSQIGFKKKWLPTIETVYSLLLSWQVPNQWDRFQDSHLGLDGKDQRMPEVLDRLQHSDFEFVKVRSGLLYMMLGAVEQRDPRLLPGVAGDFLRHPLRNYRPKFGGQPDLSLEVLIHIDFVDEAGFDLDLVFSDEQKRGPNHLVVV